MALTFDANYYLTHRPDVFQAFVATAGSTGLSWAQFAQQHYNNHGRFEGANPNAIFNTSEYLVANTDVAALGINPFEHYLNHGVHEGRAPSASFPKLGAEFNADAYLSANPDLVDAGITTPEQAYAHFVLHGQFEGRPGAPEVDQGVPGETYELTTGIDNIPGTANNDTINASWNAAANNPFGGLDVIDGAGGKDTLNVADSTAAGTFSFNGATIKNVEVINVSTNSDFAGLDISGIAGLETFNGTSAATTASTITAANSTDVNLTLATTSNSTVSGGKAVSVTKGAAAGGTLGVSGKGLTEVTIKGGQGAVTINNQEDSVAATANKGTTLKSVTLDGVDANTGIGGEGLESVTVKGATTGGRTVTITNAKANHELTVNVDGTGYTAAGGAAQTTVADAAAKTITVNATGAKSNLSLAGSTAATTVNITGSADLTLAALASATKINGSAASGGLTLGTLAAGTVDVSTGSGADSFTLSATAKATVDAGAGNDTVTLASAVAAGSTINLGAGDDKLLVGAGGSVAASTASATTVIDGGDGVDTVSASLINAANAAQFKNFENLDLSAATATALDVELVTASTITGLTLTGGAGGATANNVAAGVGLTVAGTNTGATTIGVKGAAAGTADSFTTTFVGEAAAGATEAAPTAISAGTVVTNGIESLNIVSGGTGFVSNSITVTDDALQTLTITGDKALTLAFAGVNGTTPTGPSDTVNGVKLIDGSAATGALNIDTTNVTNVANVGLTVNGGSAADTITLAQKATVDAGAGNDTITTSAAGGTLTGGAGADKFDVAATVATAATEAGAVLTTITDFSAGDSIKLLAGNVLTGATLGAKTELSPSVTNLDTALTIAALTDTANEVSWFQYAGNTYLVANDGTVGLGAGDLVVKLTGLIDLSAATLDTTTDYLTLA